MRWAFWRKEPEPPKQPTRRFAPPPEKKGNTEVQKRPSKAPATEEPAAPPPRRGGTEVVKNASKAPAVAETPVETPGTREFAPATPPFGTPAVDAASKERLGEMLVRKGFISEEALGKALDVQRSLRADTHLGEILVREKVLTEEQLATTISRQYKIPFLRIDNYDLKKDILDLIPGNEARRLRAVPIDKLGRILSVAMVNPLDETAVAELGQLTGLKIKPIICLSTDMKKVLEMYYPSKKGSTIMLRRGDTPPPFPSVQVPPPASEQMVPDAGMTPPAAPPAPPPTPAAVTGRIVPRGVETKVHPMEAPGPATILRKATQPSSASIAPVPAPRNEPATPAEPIPEDAFQDAISTHPETILRRGQGQPQGVRRKAIPASQIQDGEFVLFVGALPKR